MYTTTTFLKFYQKGKVEVNICQRVRENQMPYCIGPNFGPLYILATIFYIVHIQRITLFLIIFLRDFFSPQTPHFPEKKKNRKSLSAEGEEEKENGGPAYR